MELLKESTENSQRVEEKDKELLVSGSTCKELGNHNLIITSKKLKGLKNQQLFLDPWAEDIGQSASSQNRES